MNTDLSVAPEIARLAAPLVPPSTPSPCRAPTAGWRATSRSLAASPERWWDLVRFDSTRPGPHPADQRFRRLGFRRLGFQRGVSNSSVSDSWLLVLPLA